MRQRPASPPRTRAAAIKHLLDLGWIVQEQADRPRDFPRHIAVANLMPLAGDPRCLRAEHFP